MAVSRRWSIGRFAGLATSLVLIAATLTGCIVVPAPWHPYGPRYFYR